MKHIWVVEDDVNIQHLLNLTLQNKQYVLRFFDNGQDAVNAIKVGEVPDLIILDIMMSRLDGYGVLTFLRRTYNAAELPIIFLSAITDKESVTEGLHLGANDYITKPYHNKELIARIEGALRTTSLAKQNQETLQQLKKLDELKDQALMVVSHDLKGPVSTFEAGLQMLKENINVKPKDAKIYRQLLDSMTSSAEMMRHLVKEFLDLQAIKSQHLQLQKQRINLNLIVEDVVDQYRSLCQRKGIEIALELEERLQDSTGDPLRLKQVVSNLLNNAIKYSPPESSITIRTALVDSSIHVEVIDEGSGIRQEDLALLFKAFSSLNNPHTGDKSGTGIGLYIAQKLVEMHQGGLYVESKVDEGSTFWFELPLDAFADHDQHFSSPELLVS